jgi:lipopolysaccharide transport system ATP-binding protein
MKNSNITIPQFPVISVQNIGITFEQKGLFTKNKNEALKDVSFNLYKGETLGIVGKNGSGKSTLLRLLAGVYHPDKGRIINHAEKVALLSLQLGFIPMLSGRDNAILGGMLLDNSKQEIMSKLDEIISFADLEEHIDKPLRTYSTGMKAKLGFSVACHLKTDVLLIDEVLAVGDANFRKKSYQVMQSLIQSDKTIVLVLHNNAKLKQLCSRIVWIENGVTQMEGPADEVIKAYENYLELTYK